MITLIKSHFEKLLLILAGVALLLSAGWCWRREGVTRQPLRGLDRSHNDYRPSASAASPAAADWSAPVAQAAGEDWIYEVFSPPFIHREASTGKFTAGIPRTAGAGASESGIRLLAIRAAPYRVQFQGGFGPAGGYVAALTAIETRDVWCGRPGERWAAMAVVLEKLDAGSGAWAREGPDSGIGCLARAVVRDEKTGQQVTLVAGVPTLTHDLLATIQLANSSKRQNLREGDICSDGAFAYRVDRLSLTPVAVAVVTKMELDRETDETLLLRPNTAATGAPDVGRADSSFPPHLFITGRSRL